VTSEYSFMIWYDIKKVSKIGINLQTQVLLVSEVRNDLLCVEWDVKHYSFTQCFNVEMSYRLLARPLRAAVVYSVHYYSFDVDLRFRNWCLL